MSYDVGGGVNKHELVRLVRDMADKIEDLTDADWNACPSSLDGECHGIPLPSDDGFIREVICAHCKDSLWKSNVKAVST